MNRVLLDTDMLSEILKGKDETVARRSESYLSHYGKLITSAITVAEIVKGLHLKGRDDAMATFMHTLAAIEVLPLDESAGVIAGKIYAELDKTGRPIGRADPLIAGIAVANNLELATGNAKHFQQVVTAGFPLALVDWRSV